MNFSFDKMENALYIRFSHEKILNSDETAEGIIDYGKDGSFETAFQKN